jgi:hypothetical protein
VTDDLQRPLHLSKAVPGVTAQASREASHDRDGATGQADDVVSDGADQVAGEAPRLQPLKSRPLGPAEKCSIPDLFSANSLAVPGKVLPVLRLGMHDVEMGRPGNQDGLLRAGRQPIAKPVFGLGQNLALLRPGFVFADFLIQIMVNGLF